MSDSANFITEVPNVLDAQGFFPPFLHSISLMSFPHKRQKKKVKAMERLVASEAAD